jgi:hypothetical protein
LWIISLLFQWYFSIATLLVASWLLPPNEKATEGPGYRTGTPVEIMGKAGEIKKHHLEKAS